MRKPGPDVAAGPLGCIRAFGAAAMVACALTTLPGDAGACGNDVLPIENRRLAMVKLAKEALVAENHPNAASIIHAAFPSIDEASPGNDYTVVGALRVLALAVARSGGNVSPRRTVKRPASENLEWAVEALRRINEHRKNEPWRQTDLAEAMAKLPKYKAEARTLLEGLVARDVVATAEGYATLAKLRSDDGDAAGRDAAIARCRTMTRRPSMCDPKKV